MRLTKTILFSFSLLLLQTTFLFAGKVTLTTYYPAPNGEYSALQSTGSCVGSTCATGDAIPDKFQVKGGACVGTNCTVADVTSDNLKIKGNVNATGNVNTTGTVTVGSLVVTPGTPGAPTDGQMWIQ